MCVDVEENGRAISIIHSPGEPQGFTGVHRQPHGGEKRVKALVVGPRGTEFKQAALADGVRLRAMAGGIRGCCQGEDAHDRPNEEDIQSSSSWVIADHDSEETRTQP